MNQHRLASWKQPEISIVRVVRVDTVLLLFFCSALIIWRLRRTGCTLSAELNNRECILRFHCRIEECDGRIRFGLYWDNITNSSRRLAWSFLYHGKLNFCHFSSDLNEMFCCPVAMGWTFIELSYEVIWKGNMREIWHSSVKVWSMGTWWSVGKQWCVFSRRSLVYEQSDPL